MGRGFNDDLRLPGHERIDTRDKSDAVVFCQRGPAGGAAATADRSHFDAGTEVAPADVLEEQARNRPSAENRDTHGFQPLGEERRILP